MIILLPPSEGKAEGGDAGTPWAPASTRVPGAAGKVVGAMRTEAAAALARVRGGDARLLGVSGTHLERARRANARLAGAATLPAWRRYSGVVWENLDIDSMAAADRRRATGTIWVVSGLAGLVRADEALPDYRLKMGARLAPMGALAPWWRPAVTAALVSVARGALVVDLLPVEHRAAIDWPGLADAGVAVARVEVTARSGPPGGHFAKAAKGALARRLVEEFSGVEAGPAAGKVLARVAKSFRHGAHEARVVTGGVRSGKK